MHDMLYVSIIMLCTDDCYQLKGVARFLTGKNNCTQSCVVNTFSGVRTLPGDIATLEGGDTSQKQFWIPADIMVLLNQHLSNLTQVLARCCLK